MSRGGFRQNTAEHVPPLTEAGAGPASCSSEARFHGSVCLHSQSALGCVLPARPPRHTMLLLLEGMGLPDWWESPVGQGQSAEDEQHATPPQDRLALSVQHEAQEGLPGRDDSEAGTPDLPSCS